MTAIIVWALCGHSLTNKRPLRLLLLDVVYGRSRCRNAHRQLHTVATVTMKFGIAGWKTMLDQEYLFGYDCL